MKSGQNLQAGRQVIDKADNFCYLGSVLSQDSSCDINIKIRLGKANSNFGWLNNIRRSKSNMKLRLYNSMILSTLLYASKTRPMTITNMKKLEAAHHSGNGKWWASHGEKGYKRWGEAEAGMVKLVVILRKRRLHWLGHLHLMGNDWNAKQAFNWQASDSNRKRGRPRKNWRSTVTEDLLNIGLTSENVEEVAGDRPRWQSRVAWCAGGTWT